jgi:CheY-like chemotaxis protein
MVNEEDEGISTGAGPLVLVVDDDPAAGTAVCRMVRGLGYRAQACESGPQALRYIEAQPRQVRLLLADLDMPRMDGGELIERARDLDPTLRVALMAGVHDARTEELLAGYRDLPLLAKPVGFADLYGQLRDLLGPPPMGPSRSPAPGRSARPRSPRRPSGQHEV